MIVYETIKKDKQIWKFSAYGFLKNLKFFEPYLIIFLLGNQINLLEIGFLFSIREAIMYLFEVPSGIIADYFGKKKELYMCFSFYIVAFVFFFFTSSFFIAALGMVFYGLGEAFRSGTHKAMIYSYLEDKGWKEHKTYVYGRTRSFSLLGSAISSVLAIVLILNVPSSRYIFLASILPYILDLMLIMSYPKSLDGGTGHISQSFMSLMKSHLVEILSQKNLRKILIGTACFEGVFKSIKDYIQPILEVMILSSGVVFITSLSEDQNLKVVLGIAYGVIYLMGSVASKKTYLLRERFSARAIMNVLFILMSLTIGLIAIAVKMNFKWGILFFFLMLYLLKDIRKPVFVDICDDYMEKHQRATALSVESQIKAMITIVLAPLLGGIAEYFGVSSMLFTASGMMLVAFMYIRLKKI